MSILTKIFVVLTTILALLLVALIVPYVQNTTRQADENKELQAQLSTARIQAREAESQRSSMAQSHAQDMQQLQQQVASLQAQHDELLSQLAQKQADLVRARNNAEQAQARLVELTSSAEQNAQIISMLEDEVKQRRNETLDLRTKFIAASDRNNELQTQLDTMVQQVQLFKEQMFDLQQRYEELVDQVDQGQKPGATQAVTEAEAETPSVPGPATPIQGSIIEVKKYGDVTYLAINVGSNDGVREGMEFMIHKDQHFLGNMVVTSVDLNSSSGRVTLASDPQNIRSDVQVLAGGL